MTVHDRFCESSSQTVSRMSKSDECTSVLQTTRLCALSVPRDYLAAPPAPSALCVQMWMPRHSRWVVPWKDDAKGVTGQLSASYEYALL
eukprot:2454071-Pyramimonas_sp.AAC.1